MSYTKDADNNEVYEKDSQRNDKVEHGRYAKDKNGQAYYPTDKDGNEFKDAALGFIKREGVIVLPINNLGKPIYDKDNNNDEVYTMDNGKPILGYGRDGHQYYAKKANLDEFYPPDNTFATKLDGCKYYATDRNAGTVFPKDKDNNEYYIGLVDLDTVHTIPSRYARDKDLNEFYPKTITADGFEADIILNEQYAQKHANSAKFYPKDAFNNEFYLPQKKLDKTDKPIAERLLEKYAVTNDKKVILPELDNKPHIGAGGTLVAGITEQKVLGRLVREQKKLSDFLTSVEDPNAPVVEPREYKYQNDKKTIVTVTPQNSKPVARVSPIVKTSTGTCSASSAITKPLYKSWYFWVLVIVSLIVKSFAVWWFFLKNKKSYFYR